jgi:predicted nucleic acid-binding protein
VRQPPFDDDVALRRLDDGERAVIALATTTAAELLLMDDRAGVIAARTTRRLAVTGTLGLLIIAARHGLVDLSAAFTRLRTTSFRYRQDLLDSLLAQYLRNPRDQGY